MKYQFAGLACVLAITAPAIAQDTETQQILKLLQGMNQRFDGIEQRLDKVERGTSEPEAAVPAAAPAPVPASPPATVAPVVTTLAPPPGRAVPGWRIDVFPLTEEGVSKSLIARTSAPIGETHLDLHFDGGPVSNQVNYHGTAFFRAREAGNYTFSIVLDNSKAEAGSYWNCEATFRLEDREIVPTFSSNAPRSMSGNIDLQPGNYAASYDVRCWERHYATNYVMNEHEIERNYKKLAFDIKVLPPDEMKLRDFEPDELFYVAPPEKRRSQAGPRALAPQVLAPADAEPPAMAYAPAQPEMELETLQVRTVGTGGRTNGVANLRDGPSKQAAMFVRLPPNLSLYVMEQVGDWYRVRLRSGDVGFIHQSLINLR